MRVGDLTDLYDYSYWANKKLFDVVLQLTTEEFTRSVAGSYSSIRNTMVHVMSAEWGWLERCGGAKRGPQLKPGEYPTASSVMETWGKVEGHVRAFLSTLKDEDLSRRLEFTLDGPEKHSMLLGQMMEHGAIHGIHHRAQAAMMVRMLGYTPGNFDMVFYFEEAARESRRHR
ncbi:MAG: DinB family protein [Acidobacteriota bacterium]